MEYVIVDNEYERTAVCRQVYALLSVFSQYDRIYKDRESLVQMSAYFLQSLTNAVNRYRKQCNYLQRVIIAEYVRGAKDRLSDEQFKSYLSQKEASDQLIESIKALETSISLHENYIKDTYNVSVDSQSAKEKNYYGLEAKSEYRDTNVTKYIYGAEVISGLESFIQEAMSPYNDTKKSFFSLDSTFGKRLYHVIHAMQVDLQTNLDAYNQTRRTLQVYDLSLLLFEREANYSSEKMLRLVQRNNGQSIMTLCNRYIRIKGAEQT